MMRLLFITCSTVLLLGCLATAQEPANQDLSRFPYSQGRMRRGQPASPNPGSPQAGAQPMPNVAPAQLPQQLPPQQQVQPPQTTPAPAIAEAPQPDNLPPPTPPLVTYRDGLLTVQAMNSTLAGLLNAIRNTTGIQFEGLEAGAPERVAVSIGPAPEGEVLTAILGGSKFDYVVLERPDSPGTVQRVLLTPRGTGLNAGSPPPLRARSEGEDEEEEQAATEAEPQDAPARPPLSQFQPPQPQQPQQQPNQPTPEQLMERLKQMQQQQLQQQQAVPNQTAPVKPPPM